MTNPLRPEERLGGKRAIVIGASMAGLLAARVLSEHFDNVDVVERDALTDSSEPRKSVPQGRHLHGLLKRGELLLEELFPGLVPALVKGGAQSFDFSSDLLWYHFGVEKVRFDSGFFCLALSRPFLEAEVRRRVFALPGVRLLDDRDVLGLVAADGGRRVAGIRLQKRGGEGAGQAEELLGDLVVDASGRGSVAPRWLTELGYSAPEETSVAVKVGYATRMYRRPEPTGLPSKAIYILATPPESTRVGALFPIEGQRWIVALGGMLGDHPPSDVDGYLQFAKSLPSQALYDAIAKAEPISDIDTYKFASNRRRHYERLERAPEAFVVMGDALCSFNPIYGQGITTAGLEAVALGACLREQRRRGGGVDGLAKRAQAAAAKEVDVPWSMTTSEDFRSPQVEGKRPFGHAALSWYLGRVHLAAARDKEVARCFLGAMHMLNSPTSLMSPAIVARVLAGGIG